MSYNKKEKKDFSSFTDFKIRERTVTMCGSKEYEYIVERYLGTDAEISIPLGVNKIGQNAFFGCDTVRAIHVPNSIYELRTRAFDGCHNLNTIYLEGGYFKLADSVFCGAPSPLKVVFSGDAATWQRMVESGTVTEESYDNGWGGGAGGVYSKTYSLNPLGHTLCEGFTVEAHCLADGDTVVSQGTLQGGKLIESSTPYDN